MRLKHLTSTRRAALAGGAALVLGGVAAATVAAQQASPSSEVAGDTIFLSSGDEGLFNTSLEDRRKQWLKSVADKLGTTADKVEQAMQDATSEQGFPPLPMLAPFPVRPGGEVGTFSLKIDSDLAIAARTIGIGEDQLRQEGKGKSLSAVATAHNVDPKTVADAIKAQRRAELDKAVAAGNLPASMADRLKANLDNDVDRLMNLPGIPSGGLFFVERNVRDGGP